jgi:hypothetical protein
MSEQMDMFNSNESLSLLAELSILRPKLQKNQREMKWLRNPEITSAGNDWAFIVPSCFNDALDIKKTLRIKAAIFFTARRLHIRIGLKLFLMDYM